MGLESSSALGTGLLASGHTEASVFQDDAPEKVNSDVPGSMADDVPVAQETVQVIPGSKLLWRINSRPPNSAQVCYPSLRPGLSAAGYSCLYLSSHAHNSVSKQTGRLHHIPIILRALTP